MEIFQDGAFPNLEYHLFQVIWFVSALIMLFYCKNDTYSGNRHINVGFKHTCTHLIGFHGNIPR